MTNRNVIPFPNKTDATAKKTFCLIHQQEISAGAVNSLDAVLSSVSWILYIFYSNMFLPRKNSHKTQLQASVHLLLHSFSSLYSKKKKKPLLKWLNKTRRQCSAPAHDDDDDVDDGGSGGDEDIQSASCCGSQFLAVRTTDVTKLPKATTRAPSINFQESPWKRHKQQEESRWSQNRTCLHIFCWGSQMVSSWRE